MCMILGTVKCKYGLIRGAGVMNHDLGEKGYFRERPNVPP